MKRLFFTCLSVLLLLATYSQNGSRDRLFNILASTHQDTSKVHALLALSQFYMGFKPDSALLFARQAFALSHQLSFKKGEAKSLNHMATAYLVVNDRPQALQSYLQALKIYELLNDEMDIANTLHFIGLSYMDQQDYKLALNYLNRSKRINEKLHNLPGVMANLLGLGSTYEEMNQLDSARIFTFKANEIAFQLKDTARIGMTYRILGDIHLKMDQPVMAKAYYRQSLVFNIKALNYYGVSNAMLSMATLFQKEGQKDSMLFYARNSLAVAQERGFPQLILNASSFLADHFKGINKIDSAFAYQQIVMKIKDTLFSQDKIKSLQQLTFNEHERQQELAEKLRRQAQERKENLQLLGIAIFIPLFFVLVLVLSRRNVGQGKIEFLGTFSLLMLFEFIALFIHPYIEEWTHHTPVLMLLILIGVGAILVPLHHKLGHWVQDLLLKKQKNQSGTTKVKDVALTENQIVTGANSKTE